jgi:hypothetical protein
MHTPTFVQAEWPTMPIGLLQDMQTSLLLRKKAHDIERC